MLEVDVSKLTTGSERLRELHLDSVKEWLRVCETSRAVFKVEIKNRNCETVLK